MKNFFKSIFTKPKPNPVNAETQAVQEQAYQQRINNEVEFYKDCQVVHELPPIFHYWSNKYLLPKHKPFGFINPDDFFIKYSLKVCQKLSNSQSVNILSVGSGNGDLEINIAVALTEAGFSDFSIECMDINDSMLNRTLQAAKDKEVAQHIKTNACDFNKWNPSKDYDLIIANQSLHHVLELEHLFDSIQQGLTSEGLFITSDMIGRNGHMRWPEAMDLLQPFWDELPKSYQYNQLLKRHEQSYINHDCSTEGFEGIRAQDVLPLLVERFNFDLFIPFANIVMVLIDRPFGHNFDATKQWDMDFIDRVHALDDASIMNGDIKPTQMYAVMTKEKVSQMQLLDPKLTPEFCIRNSH